MKKRVILFIFYIIVICLCSIIRHYNIEKTISDDIPIDINIETAQDINNYLNDVVFNMYPCNKYDNLAINEIYMDLDKNYRGIIKVTVLEKNKKNPRAMLIFLNTKTNILNIAYIGRDVNFRTDIINVSDWNVDSDEALAIAEKLHSNENDNFRYDDICIKTCSYFQGDKETWDVDLTDNINNIRYETRICPYTKDILSKTIRTM